MKNVKFRGKKTNSVVKFRGEIPRQNPNFVGRGKLWALIIMLSTMFPLIL